jgi:hypothetical protein
MKEVKKEGREEKKGKRNKEKERKNRKENLNRPITSKEIKFYLKPPTKKRPEPDVSLVNSEKY